MSILVSACAERASTEGVETTRPVTPAVTEAHEIPAALENFPVATVLLGDEPLLVAVADTVHRRRSGLTHVASLGDLDGMLFVYEQATVVGFVMRDTLIPLDIAFFDDDGRLLAVRTMIPCEAEPCPIYQPPLPFRWALEAPAGSLLGLRPDQRLKVGG